MGILSQIPPEQDVYTKCAHANKHNKHAKEFPINGIVFTLGRT